MLNRKLAVYIEIAHKQRARQREVFKSQFGEDSGAVAEADKELGELSDYINNLKIYGNETVTVDGKPDLFAAADKAPAPEAKK